MTTTRFVTTHNILQLDATHPYAAKALTDAQHMHRLIMSGFRGWVADGDTEPRAQMGILSTWSIDLRSNNLLIVVQARVPADWTTIPRAALTQQPQRINVDQTIKADETFTLRTVISPTHDQAIGKADTDGQRTYRRRAHTNPDGVRQWLIPRLQQPGEPATGPNGLRRIGITTDLTTLGIRMLPPSVTDHHKNLRITRAELKGTVTVTDPRAFTDALTHGLGRGRAYSCGLLLARPSPH
ncbi:type I-E CRISPR-associated protein Cas6/Cse3/CasE [Streptomyces nojiriensis]|uniref:type I-E CRISPR-associated protein Cas6/Cse3/CasE n=1 Tax=Streptomyces nojiriensis TaxID=66374 RepID=UPI0035D61CBE